MAAKAEATLPDLWASALEAVNDNQNRRSGALDALVLCLFEALCSLSSYRHRKLVRLPVSLTTITADVTEAHAMHIRLQL